PLGIGQEAIETGLVGGLSKLTVDATHVLAFGHEQASEVLGEVVALGFVGQQVAELVEGFLNHGGEVDDTGHGCLPRRRQDHLGQCTKIDANGSPKLSLQNTSWN